MSGNHNSDLQPLPMDGTRLVSAGQAQVTPEGLLTATPLTTVNLPPGFCFSGQTGFPCVQASTGQANGPLPPSPLNMTLGFPVGQPFMQSFSVPQICTTVNQALNNGPISQAILAVSNPQGPFLSSPFSPFSPLLMSGTPAQVFSTVAGLQNVTSLSGPTGITSLPLTSVQSGPITTGPLIAGPVESFTTVTIPSEGAVTSMVAKTDHAEAEVPPGPASRGDHSARDMAASTAPAEPVAMEPEEDTQLEVTSSPAKKTGSSVCVKQEALALETGDETEGKATQEGARDDDKGDEFLKDQPQDVTTKMEVEDDDGAGEGEEVEFLWDDYLQETGAQAVPHSAFKHVESSLQSGIEKGMKLEVPNKDCPGTFWVASVVLTCGPILQLRFEGYEDDGSQDFWIQLNTTEIHPIGWCSANEKVLQPPDALKDKFTDWRETLKKVLTGAKTAPNYLLDKNMGVAPADQLAEGMRLEMQEVDYPVHTWIVRVVSNVGGRLQLQYEGLGEELEGFWLFYLDPHLHPIGWTKEQGYTYTAPPAVRKEKSEAELKEVLEQALKLAEDNMPPESIFKDQQQIPRHQFEVGHKMELLEQEGGSTRVRPATVVERLNDYYFMVQADCLDPNLPPAPRVCCHARSHSILPFMWGQHKGFQLTPPLGWSGPDFSWPEYLASTGARAAPETFFDLIVASSAHEFEQGMKLEAVNPKNPSEICAASVTKIIHCLLWIHLDTASAAEPSFVEPAHSLNLFPIGWCESNTYPLTTPRKIRPRPKLKQVAVVQPEMAEGLSNDGSTLTMSYTQVKNSESSNTWCPSIYFNHRCFSGPFLNKGNISNLPKSVGPGPIVLVMKEVLSMIVTVAYKSCRVLKELQVEGEGNPMMYQITLKAKYKGKSYRANVEICKYTHQLEEYCRRICLKLECCPYLVSPHNVNENCPENCYQHRKTKYTHYGKKKRKIGRPPGGHSNLEHGPKKPGKRKKRRKINLQHKKSSSVSRQNSMMGIEGEGREDDKVSVASTRTTDSNYSGDSQEAKATAPSTAGHPAPNRRKRKYEHHIPPPSEIRTRGAKVPRVSFERRTHKKIILPMPAAQQAKNKQLRRHHSVPYMRHRSESGSSLGQPGSAPLRKVKEEQQSSALPPRPPDALQLEQNPLEWTVADVVDFINSTDCSNLARLLKEQEIDGQALLLLTLPTIQEHLELKLGPAVKLCHHIERVKYAFYEKFAV